MLQPLGCLREHLPGDTSAASRPFYLSVHDGSSSFPLLDSSCHTLSQAPSTALTSCVLCLSRQGDVSRPLPYVTLGACLITSLCPSFQTRGPYSSSKAVLGQVPPSGLCKQRPSSLRLPRQKGDSSWHRVPGAARPWLFQLPEWKELGFWLQPHPSPSGTALGKSLTPSLLLVRCHPDRLPSERPTRGSWLTCAGLTS